MNNDKYYLMSEKELYDKLNLKNIGLSSKEASLRLLKYGLNELPRKKKDSVIKLFFKSMIDPIIILLIFAILSSFFIGEIVDAIAIIFIIIIDLIMETYQENKALKTAESLSNLVKEKVKVLRDNKELIVDSKLKEYDGKYKLGVAINQINDYITSPNIYFDLKDNELGPSGGLMAAIDIYNKITNSNLTKGDKITGTGTIDAEGNVGEIGGVKYKLIGAVNNGAKVFLCPKENYEEALKVAQDKKYDIIIKEVNTLSDAINYLKER